MKKTFRILALVLVLLLVITATATASQPEEVQGYVPLGSLSGTATSLEYDVCDPYIVGHAVQPIGEPGLTVFGEVTFGNIGDPDCDYSTELSGTCEYMIIPVEDFGNPDSKPGRGVFFNCTGDAEGLHGRAVINFDYTYTAWYHWEP